MTGDQFVLAILLTIGGYVGLCWLIMQAHRREEMRKMYRRWADEDRIRRAGEPLPQPPRGKLHTEGEYR